MIIETKLAPLFNRTKMKANLTHYLERHEFMLYFKHIQNVTLVPNINNL
jgi:hypothetical protein